MPSRGHRRKGILGSGESTDGGGREGAIDVEEFGVGVIY